MGWRSAGVAIVLLAVAAGAAAAQPLPLTPLTPPVMPVPGQGGRQPFGSSGIDDPLRGLGRQVNPLDAPIQGDLGRYLDDPLPGPVPAPLRSVQPPPRPVCPGLGPTPTRPGLAGENWRCPVLR